LPSDSASSTCIPQLVINELDYDQPGSDLAEFIELFNPSNCEFSTDGYRLELINGGNGTATAYASIDLSDAGPVISSHTYLVIGAESVIASLPQDVPSILLPSSIQNGSPDGIQVVDDSGVIDSLSYGGVIDGITELNPASEDSGEGSLARCPNGNDSDDNATDFQSTAVSTPGTENHCVPVE